MRAAALSEHIVSHGEDNALVYWYLLLLIQVFATG